MRKRDGSHDIAHHERIKPRYGSREDFDAFVDAAHRRVAVIAERVQENS